MAEIHPAIRGLPNVFFHYFPELQSHPLPEERLADCTQCPMSHPSPSRPWHFLEEVRCCNYHPSLPNHTVGRILLDGGLGAERVSALIQGNKGIESKGVMVPPDWRKHYLELRLVEDFGQIPSCRCPYWKGGELACSIWNHRDAVCRTWHCKHGTGMEGAKTWLQIRELLHFVEFGLAEWCIHTLGECTADSLEGWSKYFKECADLVEHAAQIGQYPVLEGRVDEEREALRARLSTQDRPIPPLLVSRVSGFETFENHVHIHGYSIFDGAEFPRSVFFFLARLDGETPWRTALTETQLEAPDFTKSHVVALFRIGAIDEVDADWYEKGNSVHGPLLESTSSNR
jgi:hypothetical protein